MSRNDRRGTRYFGVRMIILRCTSRAADVLDLSPADEPPLGTSPLGDWYLHLIPTRGGGLFLFMNEQSLLTVVVPMEEPELLETFVARVGNILSLCGLDNDRIEQELEHFREASVARTNSRSLIAIMNDLARRYQEAVDRATRRSKVSLSDLELKLASMPQAKLGFRTAGDVALDLLSSQAKFGAV